MIISLKDDDSITYGGQNLPCVNLRHIHLWLTPILLYIKRAAEIGFYTSIYLLRPASCIAAGYFGIVCDCQIAQFV